MKIDVEHNQPCDIGLDCPAGQGCDIPSKTCMPYGVATVYIPPDRKTRDDWTGQLFAKVEEALIQWKQTEISYRTMRYEREEWNRPLVGNGWSQSQDDQFWLMNEVAMTMAKYVGEIDEGVREVALDAFGKQPAAGGDLGDMILRAKNGVLDVKFGSAKGSVDPSGFVGQPIPWQAVVIVACFTLIEVSLFLSIAFVIYTYINKLIQKDVLDHTEEEAKRRIAAGEDPKSAYQGATDDTAKLLKALTEKATADAKGGPAGAMETFEKIAWIALGIAVVGVTAYFVSPFIRDALASSRSSPRLAQANPVLRGKELAALQHINSKGNQGAIVGTAGGAIKSNPVDERTANKLRDMGLITIKPEPWTTWNIARLTDEGRNVLHTALTTSLSPGNRVQLHPGTDRWMMGDRYGEAVEVSGDMVRVHLDKSGKKIWFKIADVTEI